MSRSKLPSLKEQKINKNDEDNETIPLPIQELAFMIVNTIYSEPQLLEQLNTLVANWILDTYSKQQVTKLLLDTNNSEQYVQLLVQSLGNVVSSLAKTQEV